MQAIANPPFEDRGSSVSPSNGREPIDATELYELLRRIRDPEYPQTLEELAVIRLNDILVDDSGSYIHIAFTPTVPHCSMTALIGLCIRVKLQYCLPARFKVDVTVAPGSHIQEAAVNKQLNDKERVAAAIENVALLRVVTACIQDS